ncbi:hypothetical protein [Bacteroides congonensis]|uniref:hypothetical protein n=1 Tax=Bacteroides congonensis TaxID=1871006 RepID=UPI001E521578|nr:hypothetical protein [Bacteroides congonensis]
MADMSVKKELEHFITEVEGWITRMNKKGENMIQLSPTELEYLMNHTYILYGKVDHDIKDVFLSIGLIEGYDDGIFKKNDLELFLKILKS